VRVSTEGRRAAAVTGSTRALARRYARALLDVARAEGPGVDQTIGAELGSLAALLKSNAELRATLLHPALGPEQRRRVLLAIAEAAQASPLLRRALELVAVRDRVALLPELAEAFAEVRNAEQGVVTAEAVTAQPLDAGQATGLRDAVRQLTGKQVELRARVDAGVLGGVLVRVGGRTYDGTVRGQLAALRARLASS
jgi:F-type H+-transporting ATPase subunit delta